MLLLGGGGGGDFLMLNANVKTLILRDHHKI